MTTSDQPHRPRPGPWLSAAAFRGRRTMAVTVVAVFLSACPPMNPVRMKVTSPPLPGRTAAAPVFERGPGRAGAAPGLEPHPVFLDQDEGVDLIVRELFYHGVRAFEEDAEIEGLHLPGRGRRVDAYDRQLGVAIVFVSRADLDEGDPGPDRARSYDLKARAGAITASASGQPPRIYFAVFYDPLPDPAGDELRDLVYSCADPDFAGDRLACAADYYTKEHEVLARWQGRDPEIKVRSHELLSAQVRDFIAWLINQGALAPPVN